MKIQKKYLKLLLETLSSSKQKFAVARIRDEFASTVAQEYQKYEKQRIALCDELCIKDKDKKPLLKDDKYQFTEKNGEKWQKEYIILNNEEVDLPLKSVDIKTIKKVVEDTSYEPEIGEAKIIDEIIELIK